MRRHFHAARRGSQSAYKARLGRTIATSAPEFSRRARHFKPSTLKAVFADEPPATLHAARDERKPATPVAPFPRLTFPNCEVGQAGGVTGARRARRILVAQYLMALSSEHGGGEGVAMRGGTGAQGAPICISTAPEHRSRNAGPHALRSRAQRCRSPGLRLRQGSGNSSYHDIVRHILRASRPSDRRAPGCPTEHVVTGAHSFRSFERQRTDISGQRQRSLVFCR